jgi:hypothetical protein
MYTASFIKAAVIIILLKSFAGYFEVSTPRFSEKKHVIYALSGDASGSQEVPAINTPGLATLTGSYDADNNTMNYTISWNNLSGVATEIHLHAPATAGTNAPPVYTLGPTEQTGPSGKVSGSLVITDTMENFLLNGRMYYNVHSIQYPNGEIRAQVSALAN